MIFINTRPVDENAQCERRPSKAPSHQNMSPYEAAPQMARLALSLMLFYVLVSVFPCILFYPISLLSLVIPVLSIFFALCAMRRDSQSNQWPFLLIAVVGILLKIAAIVVYISLFPVRDNLRKTGGFLAKNTVKTEADSRHYRTVFFIILVAIECFLLIIGGCLKWHMVTFEQRDDRHKRRATLTTSRPLISEPA
ncbi:unnamed protein product [Caenorhabditis auriculariae]|uniref:Uncharacterized protein n=1 Tax=Caenorhabditis auriculariae TaxID=2777116 RepID=A0A8S1GZZ7_9PELO|nr:unnamed protein product [Caenorhabditis auriculariae]